MWQAILQSGPYIIGVAAAFALFTGGLFLMERGGRKRRSDTPAKPTSRVIRTIRCEGQDRAA